MAKKKPVKKSAKCPHCNGTGEKKIVNGKKKGNRGELKVCKILTERIGAGKFNRVPSSGAFGSTHILSEEAKRCLSGDLIAPRPDFLFSIENKCGYNDIEISKLLSSNCYIKPLFEFIDQACDDAIRSNRIPMVIYSKDYRDPIVILPIDNNIRKKEIKFIMDKVDSYTVFKYKNNKTEYTKWVILVLDSFLDNSEFKFFFKEDKDG